MHEDHHYSLSDLDNMILFEKDVHLNFLVDRAKQAKERQSQHQNESFIPTRDMFER